MKRLIVLGLFVVILSGCGLRERLLAPPDEVEIPDNSLKAECIKDDDTYTFVYQDDGVYQYFINDVEQDEEAVDSIIEQAFLHGSSVESYLNDEFPGACTITNFEEEDEEERE